MSYSVISDIPSDSPFELIKIDAISEAGFNFPFLLLIPKNLNSNVKIFVEGSNSVDYALDGQQDYSKQVEFEIEYAKNLCVKQDGSVFNMPYLYQQLNQPVIIPLIERCDFEHKGEFYTQMLGRNVMLDRTSKFASLNKQVLAMVDFVKEVFERQEIKTEKKSGLLGMSTSGVFAGRLAFIEPESFDVCLSICSNAVQPLPLDKFNGANLIYPLGTADYKELFGKEFNLKEYKKIKQLFIVGKDESNEKYDITKKSVLHDKEIQDLYKEVYGEVSIQTRQEKISQIFKNLGIDNTQCVVANGEHSLSGKGNIIASWAQEVLEKNVKTK